MNSKNSGLGLLFKTILWRLFCFLSFVATDGKDGQRLKLEKGGQTLFTGFAVNSTKHTMGYGLLFFILDIHLTDYQEHFMHK